jgi:hypothetical protein
MLRLNGFMQKANLMEIKELLEKKLKMFSMLCIKISFKSCLFITIEESYIQRFWKKRIY